MTHTPQGDSVALRFADRDASFPTATGTEGETAFEIKTLLSGTGLVTIDPGFGNTAACRSDITYIDGAAGILRYRGYPIEELAQQATFLEVCHLLLRGELPKPGQLDAFAAELTAQSALPEGFERVIDAFPSGTHPMITLAAAVNALAAFHTENADPTDDDQVERATIALLAQLPAIAARIHRTSAGLEPVATDSSLAYVENFLNMTFGKTEGEKGPDPLLAKAMDLLLTLHADHELNCSTSTVRVVGSSGATVFASVAAGINALSGPLHGGANQAVLEMLEQIQNTEGGIDTFIEQVKDRESKTRLMGFGHRVYKNFDPRSREIKKLAQEILNQPGANDPLFDLALQLEERALSDSYFVDRKLYPNVDFYTGVIYRALGFSTEMFTVLFALGRLPGWLAHWHELRKDPDTRIARPRQLYTGPAQRSVAARDNA
ncbi:citrate synthase [Nocardiopsis ansamitocini]|uniref:Citrate synthase n=1 Tax=Nocardiopsis ansamitocini TaxID=1670832 RepID=A0A9W6P4H9_9ACTN|nr:citrate synthase [Nocardiopsis ansamitocini]GLU47189.1 citrate synthase [Nocardiopsis ansamitocini]